MFTTLAISTPPAQVAAVVLFLVGTVLAVIKKDYYGACIGGGLALAFWPW